jgi:hypothetical protein
MYKNYDTVLDFINKETAIEGRKLEVFSKMSDYVRSSSKAMKCKRSWNINWSFWDHLLTTRRRSITS